MKIFTLLCSIDFQNCTHAIDSSATYRAGCTQNDLYCCRRWKPAGCCCGFWKWEHILKMKVHFENESIFWKWKHILKMKAHFDENFHSTMLNRFPKLYICYSFIGHLQSTVYSKWFILLQEVEASRMLLWLGTTRSEILWPKWWQPKRILGWPAFFTTWATSRYGQSLSSWFPVSRFS